MITSINGISSVSNGFKIKSNDSMTPINQSPVKNQNYFSKEYVQASKLNSLNFASTIKFTGALSGAFEDLNSSMETCKTKDKKGEAVGSRASVNKLLHDFAGEFSQAGDAIKTTIKIGDTKKIIDGHEKTMQLYSRTQIKMLDNDEENDREELLFEMAVKQPDENLLPYEKDNKPLNQQIDITLTPINYRGEGTKEQAYVLNTKSNIMAVVEDGDDVILSNNGDFKKKDRSQGVLDVHTTTLGNRKYEYFPVSPQPVEKREPQPSIGEGTEIIIGMENGRFEKEIKHSIKQFVEKVKNGEIVLKQFVAQPNAKDTQLIMLAGGFGSRAEYTNASSSAIFHDIEGGTQSTKGVFRTATGLTPMETTFITLHNAGLLDCSKDEIEIGKNIKFYLNKDINRGNGGYSVGLYNKMAREGRKQVMIFPNDSMSRMTDAVVRANKIMESGKAAIAIIAKEIPSKDVPGTFGIMKLGEDNEIVSFAEKPLTIPHGYEITEVDDKGIVHKRCLTNTFQFAVSNEAFKVLEMMEPFFSKSDSAKETRDWSKQYIPIIKTLTQDNDNEVIRKNLLKVMGKGATPVDDETIAQAKATLGNQKLVAVPTKEPWADCGTLDALYYTTMQIADGRLFKLEDFERAHVLSCINNNTGLVASTPDQKERIEAKYTINGQVMVVPQAQKITEDDVKDIPVIVNEKSEI